MFAVLQLRINRQMQELIESRLKESTELLSKAANSPRNSRVETERLRRRIKVLTESNLIRAAIVRGLSGLSASEVVELVANSEGAVARGRPRKS